MLLRSGKLTIFFIWNIRIRNIIYFEIGSFRMLCIFMLLQLTVIHCKLYILYALIIQIILEILLILFNVIIFMYLHDLFLIQALLFIIKYQKVVVCFFFLQLLNVIILNVFRILKLRWIVINLWWNIFLI